MKYKSRKLSEIREIKEKLENLCSRVDNLENLSSTNHNNNSELEVVTTEQPNDVGKKQEQQVYTFLVQNNEKKIKLKTKNLSCQII